VPPAGFTRGELSQMPGKTLTHNHPNETRSHGGVLKNLPHSPADVSVMIRCRLKDIRVVSNDFRFRIRLRPGVAIAARDVDDYCRRLQEVWDRSVRQEAAAHKERLMPLVIAGDMPASHLRATLDITQDVYQHKTWLAIADEFHLEYRRERYHE